MWFFFFFWHCYVYVCINICIKVIKIHYNINHKISWMFMKFNHHHVLLLLLLLLYYVAERQFSFILFYIYAFLCVCMVKTDTHYTLFFCGWYVVFDTLSYMYEDPNAYESGEITAGNKVYFASSFPLQIWPIAKTYATIYISNLTFWSRVFHEIDIKYT